MAEHFENEESSAADNENPFDNLDGFKLSQDFAAQVAVKKQLVRVPVRKPTKQEFVRVRHEEEYRMDVGIIELKEEQESFLLSPELMVELSGEWNPTRLYLAINRLKIPFIWPCKLTPTDGRPNSWNESALMAAELAMNKWTKVQADMSLGAYQTYTPTKDLEDEPAWPEYPFNKLLEVAFRDKIIRSIDHPVVRRLLGYE